MIWFIAPVTNLLLEREHLLLMGLHVHLDRVHYLTLYYLTIVYSMLMCHTIFTEKGCLVKKDQMP